MCMSKSEEKHEMEDWFHLRHLWGSHLDSGPVVQWQTEVKGASKAAGGLAELEHGTPATAGRQRHWKANVGTFAESSTKNGAPCLDCVCNAVLLAGDGTAGLHCTWIETAWPSGASTQTVDPREDS